MDRVTKIQSGPQIHSQGTTITFRCDGSRERWSIRFEAAPEIGIDVNDVDLVEAAEIAYLALRWRDARRAGNTLGSEMALRLLNRYVLGGSIKTNMSA